MWRRSSYNLFKHTLCTKTPPPPRFCGSHRLLTSTYCTSSTVVGGVAGGDSGGGGKDDDKFNGTAITYGEAKKLMRLVNVESLKQKLEMVNKEVISYGELIEVCSSLGLAKTPDEGASFAKTLDEAGVVLLFRDKVYLHPEKVVDLVRKAVPLVLLPEDDPTSGELEELQIKMEEIDVLAHKQVRRILFTGLGLAMVQVGLFFRLTFWEFSWDVMEPIAFFTTSTGIVLGYAYFLFTSRDPTYQDLLKRLFLSRQRKLIKRQNFDIKRFVELKKKHKRSSMGFPLSITKRVGIEVEPHEILHGH